MSNKCVQELQEAVSILKVKVNFIIKGIYFIGCAVIIEIVARLFKVI